VRRLLIVDDDEAMRISFRRHLGEDYEIIDTAEAGQAAGLAFDHEPDAILIDLNVVKFSGLDLCRQLNSFSQANLVPILVFSDSFTNGNQEACAALGAKASFSKPIDFAALKARLLTLKRRAMVPRSEVRIRLKVPLKLCGTDSHGQDFEVAVTTENVSLSGFCCNCPESLLNDAIVEVFLTHNGTHPAGRARCVRADSGEGHAPHYAFRFIEKTGTWVLK